MYEREPQFIIVTETNWLYFLLKCIFVRLYFYTQFPRYILHNFDYNYILRKFVFVNFWTCCIIIIKLMLVIPGNFTKFVNLSQLFRQTRVATYKLT